MLVLARHIGGGFYIGRDITVRLIDYVVTEASASIASHVVVMVEAPGNVLVSRDDEFTLEMHLSRTIGTREPVVQSITVPFGGGLFMGHHVIMRVGGGIETSGEVKFAIQAPRSVAVNRDDFTREQHLAFCDQRERGIEHHKVEKPCRWFEVVDNEGDPEVVARFSLPADQCAAGQQAQAAMEALNYTIFPSAPPLPARRTG